MHAFADKEDYNAQNLNAKEIAYRLNKNKFEVTLFYKNTPETRLVTRENIHLIKAEKSRFNSITILKNLLSYRYHILFYVRDFYEDKIYFKLRKIFGDRKIAIYSLENSLPFAADERYNETTKSNAVNSDYIFFVSKYVAETAKKEWKIKTPIMYVGTKYFKVPSISNPISKKISRQSPPHKRILLRRVS